MAKEDFTTYTEVDIPADRIQKTSYHADYLAYKDELCFLYDDKGANYFDEFEHIIDVKPVSAGVVGTEWANFYLLTNEKEHTLNHFRNNDLPFIVGTLFRHTSGQIWLYFGVGDATGDTFIYYSGLSYGAWYYVTILRDAINNVCKIYTDPERTNLLSTLTIPKSTRDAGLLRYVTPASTYGGSVHIWFELDIENLYLTPPVPPAPKKLVLRTSAFSGIALADITKREKVIII